MSTDITTTTDRAQGNALVTLLADPGRLAEIPVETVERLFALDREMRQEGARIAFSRAMTDLRADMAPVVKQARNSQTGSTYARLEHIDRMLSPLLVRHGFSCSVSTVESPVPESVRVRLIVRHVGGHTEEHYLDAPVDDKGIKGSPTKTRLHGLGSTLTYCERMLKVGVFDVQIVSDDDGQSAGRRGQPISREQVAELQDMIEATGADKAAFLAFFRLQFLDEMGVDQFASAMTMLRRKAAQNGGA